MHAYWIFLLISWFIIDNPTSSALPRGEWPISERSPITECVEGATEGWYEGPEENWVSTLRKQHLLPCYALFCHLRSYKTWEKAKHAGRAFCCTSYLHHLPVLPNCSPLQHENFMTPAPTASIPLPHMKCHLIEIYHKHGVFSTLALLCKSRLVQKLLNLLKKASSC